MLNTIGREVPKLLIEKMGKELYAGPFAVHPDMRFNGRKVACVEPGQSTKLLASIDEAIDKTGLADGMTISFHHHFRAGDKVLNMVMERIALKGIKDLYLASSSLSEIHWPLIEHIKNGVISGITTSGLRGELAREISKGLMKTPVIFRSHGGRARAIETGELSIDVAFMSAASSDEYGNATGERGKTICGALGYARTDSRHADQVVIITDTLAEFPNIPASIKQTDVDYVVIVNEVGDQSKISSGATRFTKNPKELLIAEKAAKVIVNSGYFINGFSFQTGSGGSSLAVTRFLEKAMIKNDIKANFALGGITEPIVKLHEKGLIKHLYDVQSFDLYAANSFVRNRLHHEIEAGYYANPFNRGCIANKLDIVILSALEIDVNFNVNVMTGSDGYIRGASGGHSDTAASAKLTIIVVPLMRGRIPSVVEQVQTVVTPGETVDVLVTDRGIAINPNRVELIKKMKAAGIKLVDIKDLQEKVTKLIGKPNPNVFDKEIVGVIEYRDGTIIDVIHKVKE